MNMRRYHSRRKGEINGKTDWKQLLRDSRFILLIALLMWGSWAWGNYHGEHKNDGKLKDVPASEYTVKGKVRK